MGKKLNYNTIATKKNRVIIYYIRKLSVTKKSKDKLKRSKPNILMYKVYLTDNILSLLFKAFFCGIDSVKYLFN
jgi:hypothetical protein